jgi:hypothetical protein
MNVIPDDDLKKYLFSRMTAPSGASCQSDEQRAIYTSLYKRFLQLKQETDYLKDTLNKVNNLCFPPCILDDPDSENESTLQCALSDIACLSQIVKLDQCTPKEATDE